MRFGYVRPGVVLGSVGDVGVPMDVQGRCLVSSRSDKPQTATCTGSGEAGTLGNGKTKDVAAPTAVAGNHTFVALSLGYEHACGLAVDALAGALYRCMSHPAFIIVTTHCT